MPTTRAQFAEAVWASELKTAVKIVALAYADHWRKGEDAVWVTWDRLTTRTGLSRASVARSLNALLAAGWFELVEPPRQYRSARYRLHPQEVQGSHSETSQSETSQSETSKAQGSHSERQGSHSEHQGSQSETRPSTYLLPNAAAAAPMSELDTFPPEQRAAAERLLELDASYEDIADCLALLAADPNIRSLGGYATRLDAAAVIDKALTWRKKQAAAEDNALAAQQRAERAREPDCFVCSKRQSECQQIPYAINGHMFTARPSELEAG